MKLFLPLALIAMIGFISCNNSSDGEGKKDDTATSHSHGMPAPGATVPELPTVPEGAKVMFKNLKQGDAVTSPFKVEMGVDVIRIDTAGPVVAGSGHHHLIIDGSDSLAAGTIIPMDSTHRHFGRGQTEVELNLPPGKHRLALQFADGLHRSYGGQLSSAITITVKR